MPASVYSAPKSLFHRLWYEPPPSLGVEFLREGVAVARWTPGHGLVEHLTTEPLPEEALRPSPVRENFQQPEEVRKALATALGRLARRGGGGNLALFLPDVAARVSVLDFHQFPEKHEEALPLIRWRLRKSVPFEIEEAAVGYQRQGGSSAPAAARGPGREVVAAAAPRAVVRQYETALESLGYHPGFVTLSSLAALGLVTPRSDGRRSGTMLLRSAGRLLTIVVTSLGGLRMFRATELPGEEAHSVEEVVTDVYGSAVYFQDNHGDTVDRIYLAGFGERTAEVQDWTERELGVRPQPLLVPGTRGEEARFLGIYGMVAEQAKQ